jgi:hypothetical protein
MAGLLSSVAELAVSDVGSIDTRTDIQQANRFLLASAGVLGRLRWRWLMATADQVRNQRADKERSHGILLKEAEFRPQFLLRDNVCADHPLDGQKR